MQIVPVEVFTPFSQYSGLLRADSMSIRPNGFVRRPTRNVIELLPSPHYDRDVAGHGSCRELHHDQDNPLE